MTRPSLPLPVFVIFFIIGICLQEKMAVSLLTEGGVFIIGIALGFLVRRKPWRRFLFWPLAGFFVGAGVCFCCAVRAFPVMLDEIFAENQVAAVEGTIDSEIARKSGEGPGPRYGFVLALHQVNRRGIWEKTTGRVWVRVYQDVDLAYGQVIKTRGRLFRPVEFVRGGRFSYREYLRRRGVKYILSVKKNYPLEVISSPKGLVPAVMRLRQNFSRLFGRYLSPAEADLMRMFFLGEKVNVAPNVRNYFVQTGTAHILAISGSHVAIVVGIFLLIVKALPCSRRMQYVLTVVYVILYAILTGGSPPIVRAAITAVIFLVSFMVERETDGINSLSLAALIILFLNPWAVFAVDFQLSFVSVLFILLFYQRLYDRLCLSKKIRNKFFCYVAAGVALTMVAWVGTAGLVGYYFEVISPVAVIANFVLVPISAVILALGMGLVALGFWAEWLAEAVAVCLKVMINLFVYLAYWLAKIPGASFSLRNITIWQVYVYYICIFALFLPRKRAGKIDKEEQL